MFIINSLKIHNFIKFKDVEINMRNQGLVWLKGENFDEPEKGKTGAGKSLFGDAIHWLLSGNTTRPVLATRIVGNNDKSCFVEAEIEIQNEKIKIIRYRNDKKYGSGVRIISHGNDVSHRNLSESQDRINKIIGCSFDLFRLSCFYNTSSKYHFSYMSSVERAKILDEIIGTDEANVTDRIKKVNILLKQKNELLVSIQNSLYNNENKILKLREVIIDNEKLQDNKIYEEQIEKIKSEITILSISKLSVLLDTLLKLKKKSNVLEEKQKELDLITNTVNKLANRIELVNYKLSDYDKKISNVSLNVKANIGELCDGCGNIITENSLECLKSKRRDEILKINLEKASVEKELIILKDNLDIQENKLKKFSELGVDENIGIDINNVENEIRKEKEKERLLENKKKDLVEYELKYRSYKSDIEKIIEKNKNEITIVKKDINFLNIKQARIEIEIEKLKTIGDFYGPSGYRPLVMSHYSPVLSDAANFYLSEFIGTKEKIIIDSKTQLASGEIRDKVDVNIYDNGQLKYFPEEFSEGERCSIDLALNFGIMRIAAMRAAKDFNFMWFDEITNGLSESLINRLITIVRNKIMRENMTVIMTSHHPLNPDLFDSVWTAVKENGICRIKQ